MDARSVGAALVVALLLLGGCGDDGEQEFAGPTTSVAGPPDSPFCEALAAMYEAQEQWTVEYLNSLTHEEAVENQAAQAAVARPVRETMPDQFVDRWDRLNRVGEEVQELVDAIRPRTGTSESLLAEARQEGYGSVSEYVFRDGLTVDGELWTYEEYVEQGASLDAEMREHCDMPPPG